MKKFVIILGLVTTAFYAFDAMADDGENVYIKKLTDEIENAVYKTDSVTLDAEAQEFIKGIENMSDDKQDLFKLLFFSERAFWRVYDDYVAILEQKSIETGRKLIKKDDGEDRSVRLDNTGVSDAKCVLEDFCEYPDGYEECDMVLHVHSDDQHMSYVLDVTCDDKQSNKVNFVEIMMDMWQRNNSGSINVSISGNERKFDEMVKYRQDERFNAAQMQKNKKSKNLKGFVPVPGGAVYNKSYSQTYGQQ